jgi:hypothetical protein
MVDMHSGLVPVVSTHGGGCLFHHWLSRRGEVWPQFPDLPPGVVERPSWHMYRDMLVKPFFPLRDSGSWWSDADEFIS